MLIAAAPIAIPVSTANPPTEAVASETARKTLIPEAKSTSESPHSRHSTDTNDQSKPALEQSRPLPAHTEQKLTDDSAQENPSSKHNQQENGRQESGQQEKGRHENAQQQGKQASDKAQSEDSKSQDSQSDRQQEQSEHLQQNKEVELLKRQDREVRAHETAHASAGGTLAGAPVLQYRTGPDGKRYAVSGEVSIDTSKVAHDPQATIAKMQQVRKAALAPANPSSQDFKVAAVASQIANQALVELNLELQEKFKSPGSEALSSEPGKDIESSQVFARTTANEEKSGSPRVYFTSPVAVRRASLALNQKIMNSGALDDPNRERLISQTA